MLLNSARTSCLLIVVVTTATATAMPVAAQRGAFGPWAVEFENPFRSIFSHALVDEIGEWFELTEDQAIIVKTLHEDHMVKFDAFRDKYEPVRDRFDDAVEGLMVTSLQRHTILLEREKELAKVADAQEVLDQEFLVAIEVVLDARQVARWEPFLKWLNRKRWSTARMVYLEQPLDLIALMEELKQSHPQAADAVPADVITEYARQMDVALQKMARFEIDFARNRMRANEDRYKTDGERVWLDAFSVDPRAQQRSLEKRRALNWRIRTINRTYRRIFVANMRETSASAWERLYRAEIARMTGANLTSRLFDRLLAEIENTIGDLDSDQIESIQSSTKQYETVTRSDFRRILDAYDARADSRHQPVEPHRRSELDKEYQASLAAFTKSEREAIKWVLNTLTPAQRELISVPNSDSDGRRNTPD